MKRVLSALAAGLVLGGCANTVAGLNQQPTEVVVQKVDKDDIRYQPKKDEDFMTYANRMKTEQGWSEAVYIGWDGGKEAVYYSA